MFFPPRRDFLKTLAWLFGASTVTGCATSQSPPATSGDAAAASSVSGANASPHGVAKAPLTPGDFDLIVVGGGFSGTAAAISAARNGVKVALVHDRSMLGGNSSSEVRLYPEGNDAYQPWIRESGIHEEIHLEDRVRNHVRYREGLTNCHWDLILYEWCIREPNLTLFLNTYMHEVRMAGKNRIAAMRLLPAMRTSCMYVVRKSVRFGSRMHHSYSTRSQWQFVSPSRYRTRLRTRSSR